MTSKVANAIVPPIAPLTHFFIIWILPPYMVLSQEDIHYYTIPVIVSQKAPDLVHKKLNINLISDSS